MTSTLEKVARAERESVDSAGHSVRTERHPSVSQKASGGFGEIERLISELVDRIVAQQSDYSSELEAIGWDSILDLRRIEQDKTLAESRIIVKQAIAIVNKYEAKTATLARDMQARIHALPRSGKVQREFLAGMYKSMSKAPASKQWALEKKAVSQVANIIELLATAQHGTGWVVESDQIHFARDADTAAYNSYIEEIHRIARQQDQIRTDNLRTINQELDEAKREFEE